MVSSTSDGDDDGEVEVGEESQYLGGCFESTTAGVTGAELQTRVASKVYIYIGGFVMWRPPALAKTDLSVAATKISTV